MTKNLRTRAVIAREALLLKTAAHKCTDRDWCDTTGETGCGAVDEKLAALRLEWKTAPKGDPKDEILTRTLDSGVVITAKYDWAKKSFGAVARFDGAVIRREWNTKFTSASEYLEDMVAFYAPFAADDFRD